MATITITVTVSNPGSGNKYYLDGVLQATYAATPGNTYKFDQSDGTNSGHPLRLSITSNGTHSGGSAYTDGVTTSGTPGSSGAYTQIVVDATTVQTLYYYCTAHSGMGGSFNVGSSSTVKLKDIKGFTVQTLSSDPTTTDSVGQFYYNSTSTTFKYVQPGTVGAWASGGALNTARNGLGGSQAGTQTAALAFGGEGSLKNESESYNGTSWTEGNNLTNARQSIAGAGTQTAALAAGGGTPAPLRALTEEYNGTSWSEQNDLNTGRYGLKAGGIQTAALVFAGTTGGSNRQATTEKYDGTSWTEVNDLNTARTDPGNLGTLQTNSLCAGGNTSPGANYISNVEIFDGTSWTEVANTNANKHGAGGAGTSTDGIIFGGNIPSVTAATEAYNGTSWTEVADLATARMALAGSGTGSLGLAFGGAQPANSALTEEFTTPEFVIKTVTTS